MICKNIHEGWCLVNDGICPFLSAILEDCPDFENAYDEKDPGHERDIREE